MNEEEIGKSFIATYYRMIFRSPTNLFHLYDPQATITRICGPQTTQVRPVPGQELSPFKGTQKVIRVEGYSSHFALDGIIVLVYGTVGSQEFTHEFILKMVGSKFVVGSETYYEFEPPRTELVRVGDVKEQSGGRSGVAQPAQKRTSVAEFDPARTVTIKGLSNTYVGDEVRDAYSREFGNITKQFYTYNTIYFEFGTVEEMEKALAGRIVYRGSYVKAERGILPAKEPPRRERIKRENKWQ